MRKVGIMYDEDFLLHETGTHPECKERLILIKDELEKQLLWEKLSHFKPNPVQLELLSQVHCSEYIARLERFAASGGGRWDPDTYVSKDSYNVALLACGAAIEATKKVVEGEVSQAIALVRPPGHHAESNTGMGFCLFNNTAVAAKYAKTVLGFDRIAIIDWDAHHGNGIENIFYDDPSVLYISIHQSPFFPGTGFVDKTGAGSGEGYNVNIPISSGTGDAGYEYIFDNLVQPIITQFRPQLILVAAGFDAYFQDPLAGLQISTRGFKKMTDKLLALSKESCSERLVFILEGGYSLPQVGKPVTAVVSSLLDEILDDSYFKGEVTDVLSPQVKDKVNEVIKWQKKYWKL